MERRLLAFAALLALAGCVPYPITEIQPDTASSTITSGVFQPLDPGSSQQDSLHFRVMAYGSEPSRQISESAEASYNAIMVDTNLFSFQPHGLYQVVVYGGPDEYRRKTRQPEWSGGVSVGNAIYSYFGPQLSQTVAHEMTHLIFFEFMGRSDISQRWVNEGLAVYEESKAAAAAGVHGDLFAGVMPTLRQQPIPMDQMITLTPASEKAYTVSLWYAQAQSMIRYMIERGGRIGFNQFLTALRDGKSYDVAINSSFPGVWRDLSDFHQAWQRSLQ